MAQTVCVLLDDAIKSAVAAIAGDRSRPLKHILRARIVLLSAERVTVKKVARRAGVSRPAVWRWQQRFAEEGVERLRRDKPLTCILDRASCEATAWSRPWVAGSPDPGS
ncbi:Homeodomain-like domain-containing protein [Methylobacterium pseudosasicola]|uniref:Homeodomain-like domain-containing protein n=1 Tax=Methylobacterium pseudosasicola TaxID=582667 RepID=A0A1I4RME4_9HYPH|nr:Homeodomain-like domain-containing protein [Methylobacterium pseudosasicola]